MHLTIDNSAPRTSRTRNCIPNRGLETRMRRTITIFSLCTMCVLAYPSTGTNRILSSDFIYFPDQADYIKLATKCPDNTILWPGDRRCYREGEQGPCNVDRALAFDWRLLKPYCKDISAAWIVSVCPLLLPTARNSLKDGSRRTEQPLTCSIES